MNQDQSQVKKTETKTHNNNPFTLALDGVKRLFQYAKPVAILLTILSAGLWLLQQTGDTDQAATSTTAGDFDATMLSSAALVGLVAVVGILLAMVMIAGISDYAAAASAKDRKVSFREAVDAVFDRFFAYLWLRVLVIVKVLLWTLLFIIPGIYFSYRYKLAGVVFFAEEKSARASIDRSLKLTKKAWLTTFTSYLILNSITFGLIQLLSNSGVGSELYRQYAQVLDNGQKQPKPHALSIVVPILIAGIIALITLAIIMFVAANPEVINTPPDTNLGFPTQRL